MSRRPVIVRSEAGFTLIEMLMAVAVLGIIGLPLTNAMVVGLRTSDRTAKVLVTSADRQMLTNYLPPDALSATVATNEGAATGGCLTADGTRVVLLNWSEFDGAFTTTYASDYRLIPGTTANRLVRDRCVAGSAANEITVAHDAAGAVATITDGKVAITVTDSLGAQYTVSGTRRAA
jgi:prepilin-type N-terminal cleavage/methylation domain-containing protein